MILCINYKRIQGFNGFFYNIFQILINKSIFRNFVFEHFKGKNIKLRLLPSKLALFLQPLKYLYFYDRTMINQNVIPSLQISIVLCILKQRINLYKNPTIHTQGPGNRGGRGARAPLELRFYRVKIFKMRKISFSILVGPP